MRTREVAIGYRQKLGIVLICLGFRVHGLKFSSASTLTVREHLCPTGLDLDRSARTYFRPGRERVEIRLGLQVWCDCSCLVRACWGGGGVIPLKLLMHLYKPQRLAAHTVRIVVVAAPVVRITMAIIAILALLAVVVVVVVVVAVSLGT